MDKFLLTTTFLYIYIYKAIGTKAKRNKIGQRTRFKRFLKHSS